jgi:cytochrome c oxidase subunit 3
MAIVCLLATLALGWAFLVVKGFEYHDDIVKGLFPGTHFPLRPAETQPFWALYWVIRAQIIDCVRCPRLVDHAT